MSQQFSWFTISSNTGRQIDGDFLDPGGVSDPITKHPHPSTPLGIIKLFYHAFLKGKQGFC